MEYALASKLIKSIELDNKVKEIPCNKVFYAKYQDPHQLNPVHRKTNLWLSNSGSTCHIANLIDEFIELNTQGDFKPIRTGGKTVQPKGIGIMKKRVEIPGGTNILTL